MIRIGMVVIVVVVAEVMLIGLPWMHKVAYLDRWPTSLVCWSISLSRGCVVQKRLNGSWSCSALRPKLRCTRRGPDAPMAKGRGSGQVGENKRTHHATGSSVATVSIRCGVKVRKTIQMLCLVIIVLSVLSFTWSHRCDVKMTTVAARIASILYRVEMDGAV